MRRGLINPVYNSSTQILVSISEPIFEKKNGASGSLNTERYTDIHPENQPKAKNSILKNFMVICTIPVTYFTTTTKIAPKQVYD